METADNGNPVKKENGFKRFLKAVFVHNFVGKITAILVSVLLWVLAVGLSSKPDSPAPDSGQQIERAESLRE